MEQNPLGYEKESKLLLNFAIPCIVSMLVTALYNIVDQIFIGQGVGLLGNAATNIAFPLSTTCTAISLLLGIGGASNFSLKLGAGEKKEAERFAANAIVLMAISGITLMGLVQLFLTPLLNLFGATPDVFPYAVDYTRVVAIGFPFLIANTGMSKLILADGSPRYSMLSMLAGAIANTILDPLFIFTFDMGMTGAALATIIGQMLSFTISACYMFRFKSVKLEKSSFTLSPSYWKGIVSLGVSSCFNQIAMTIVQIVMNNTLAYYGAMSAYGGEIPLACAGIITKVNMIFMSFVIGIAQGSQPVVGFNYGAKRFGRVKNTYVLALKSAFKIAVVAFLCFQVFPRQIISIFGEGSEMYFAFSERYFRIYMLFTFVNGLQPVATTFFTSIGRPKLGVFISLTRQIIFLLPLIVIFPIFMGIDGVMYAGPFADAAAAIVAGVFSVKVIKEMDRKEKEMNA